MGLRAYKTTTLEELVNLDSYQGYSSQGDVLYVFKDGARRNNAEPCGSEPYGSKRTFCCENNRKRHEQEYYTPEPKGKVENFPVERRNCIITPFFPNIHWKMVSTR